MAEPILRDTFGNYLMELGKKFKDIVVLDADLSSSTKTFMFAKVFPNRFFNMGIAEQNMLGVALGFAISGKTPVVSGFSIFTTGRAWEFIRFACHDNLNIKIIPTHGGIVGEDGATHNALEDLSLMSILPNLTVLAPADNIELIQMLKFAFETKGPFYIRLSRGAFPKIHKDNYKFELGKPDVIKDGQDICLIGAGYGTSIAFKSIPFIEKEFNISVKLINLSTIKPIDEKQLINEIRDMKGIVVIEEHNLYCGLGSILARIIVKNYTIIMKFVGIDNSFVESGKREELLDFYGLNVKNIINQVSEILNKT